MQFLCFNLSNRLILCLVVWGATLLNLYGQESLNLDSVEVQYIFQPIEIRVKRNEIPYPISKINRSIILQNPALTFEPLLQSIPGIWMQTGAPNTNRISIRGVGNRVPFATSKLKVYLDEIPLTNGIGESSIEDIDPFLYDGIQIWKSPSSALWGSGLGGLIQLNTAWDDQNTLRLSHQFGSFGQLNSRAFINLRYGHESKHQTILHGQFVKQNGYRENNEYKKKGITIMHRFRANTKLRMHFFGHFIHLKAQIPSSLGITDYKNNPQSAASNWAAVSGNESYLKGLLGLNLRYVINDRWSYQASLFSQFFDSDEVRPFNILDENLYSLGTRQRIIYSINQTDFISAGFEVSREQYDWKTFKVLDQGSQGELLSVQSELRNQQYFFIQYHAQILPNANIIAGLSNTYSNQSHTGNDFNQKSLNPTLGLTYLVQKTGIVLYSSISRGFSPISISDAIDSQGKLNTNLRPEKGWSLEFGLRYASKDKQFSAEISGYRMRISDLFVQKRISEDQFTSTNAGRTHHDGIEVQFQWQPFNKINLLTSYAWSSHSFGEFIDGDKNFSGNALTGTAPHMLYNNIGFNISQKTHLYLTHRFVSRTPITDNNLVFGDAFHIFNLTFGSTISLPEKSSLGLRFGINNIFDETYASMYQINARAFGNSEPRYYYPGLPRHYFVQINYDLK
jgi:iron complex outermembrane receptor protein